MTFFVSLCFGEGFPLNEVELYEEVKDKSQGPNKKIESPLEH